MTIPPFGLSTLSLRSVKYNSVSISTHSADFELAVSAQLKSTPQIVAINHTGDGCTDLNGTRTVNILSWWHSVRKLTKLNPTLGIWAFGQYWADDSPSNRIEHLWTYISKLLASVTIPAVPAGHEKMAHLIKGLSPDEIRKKEIEVILNGMDVVQDCTKGEVVNGYRLHIRNVLPDCISDTESKTRYQSYMEFVHATAKATQANEQLKRLRAEYRLCLAHLDRRYTVSIMVAFLCHDMDPDQFGKAEDCAWCRELKRTQKLDDMLRDLTQNGGKAYAPRPSSIVGHFGTMFEERARAQRQELVRDSAYAACNNDRVAGPDEFLARPRLAIKTMPNSLFPAFSHCRHLSLIHI